MIKSFIKNNNIDMSAFEEKKYRSYNDFFTRKIKLENRPMSSSQNDLISPADSRLLCPVIDKDMRFKIKNSYYSLPEFLQDEEVITYEADDNDNLA